MPARVPCDIPFDASVPSFIRIVDQIWMAGAKQALKPGGGMVDCALSVLMIALPQLSRIPERYVDDGVFS